MKSKRSCRNRKRSDLHGNIRGYNKKIKPSFCSLQKTIPRNQGEEDHLDEALRFCEKVMNERSSEDYLALLRCLHDYGTGKITLVDLKMMVADYFPYLLEDFGRVLEFYDGKKDDVRNKKEEEEEEEEEEEKEIDELTESYRFLPKDDARRVHSSGITKIGREVLNRSCYCKGSSGAGAGRSLSPAEQKLNLREDKLFAMDMRKAWIRSTRENATKLDIAIRNGVIRNPTAKDVNSHFQGYNFRLIDKIYGKDGSLMVDRLRDEPQTFLPVLIRRLERMEIESETLPHWNLD